MLENRLSDVVWGLNREKVCKNTIRFNTSLIVFVLLIACCFISLQQQDSNKEPGASPAVPASEETVFRPTQPVAKMTAHVPDPVTSR